MGNALSRKKKELDADREKVARLRLQLAFLTWKQHVVRIKRNRVRQSAVEEAARFKEEERDLYHICKAAVVERRRVHGDELWDKWAEAQLRMDAMVGRKRAGAWAGREALVRLFLDRVRDELAARVTGLPRRSFTWKQWGTEVNNNPGIARLLEQQTPFKSVSELLMFMRVGRQDCNKRVHKIPQLKADLSEVSDKKEEMWEEDLLRAMESVFSEPAAGFTPGEIALLQGLVHTTTNTGVNAEAGGESSSPESEDEW